MRLKKKGGGWNIKLRKYYGNLIFQQFNCLTFNISMHNQIIKTLANFFFFKLFKKQLAYKNNENKF